MLDGRGEQDEGGAQGMGRGESSATATLLAIQVIHRHGARTPLTPKNKTVVCGSENGCGVLTDFGKAQLASLGTWIRTNYASLLPTDGPNLTVTESYSYQRVFSRSTDLPRTLQSSAAMLRGLFPNTTAFFPVVNTVRFLTDILCLIDAQMSFHLLDVLGSFFVLDDAAMQLFTPPQLTAMGLEADIPSLCGIFPAQYVDCAGVLQDIAASAFSAGDLQSRYPQLWSQYDNLTAMRRYINQARFPFNATAPDQQQRGSYGQILAQRLMQNFDAVRNSVDENGQLNASATRIFEYSVHDTTIMPLSATLGHNELMLPLFGETLILELWQTPNGAGGSSAGKFDYTIKLQSGRPAQGPTNLTVDMSFIPVFCIVAGETGSLNVLSNYSTPDGCPMDDFWSYVNASIPAVAGGLDAGLCYLPADAVKQMDCGKLDAPAPTESDNATAASAQCRLYRERCPTAGCPEGFLVNPVDLSCVELKPRPSLVTPSIMVVQILTSLFVGGFLALAVSDAARRWRESGTQQLNSDAPEVSPRQYRKM